MKLESTKSEFAPINLNFTIESQEELDALAFIFNFKPFMTVFPCLNCSMVRGEVSRHTTDYFKAEGFSNAADRVEEQVVACRHSTELAG